MDLALLVFLILLNGVFAMSEMALSTSRKARLQVLVESGDRGAGVALALHDNPTQFLSTVQIGITSIGVLNGIVGDAAFSGPLADWLTSTFVAIPHGAADIGATALVVVIITFLTIIFGELVPKRVGQLYPETVARLVAPTMNFISMAARPLVRLLSVTTEATLGALDSRLRLAPCARVEAYLKQGYAFTQKLIDALASGVINPFGPQDAAGFGSHPEVMQVLIVELAHLSFRKKRSVVQF